jgi:hypothetical protein
MNAKISVTLLRDTPNRCAKETVSIVLKIGTHTQMLAPFVWWPYTNIAIYQMAK